MFLGISLLRALHYASCILTPCTSPFSYVFMTYMYIKLYCLCFVLAHYVLLHFSLSSLCLTSYRYLYIHATYVHYRVNISTTTCIYILVCIISISFHVTFLVSLVFLENTPSFICLVVHMLVIYLLLYR